MSDSPSVSLQSRIDTTKRNVQESTEMTDYAQLRAPDADMLCNTATDERVAKLQKGKSKRFDKSLTHIHAVDSQMQPLHLVIWCNVTRVLLS